MINETGLYDLPESVYHSDPCPAPSLSHSIARVLLSKSPMHAKYAHPRLNTSRESSASTDAMVAGTILHTLILGKGAKIAPIDADDFRGKAAKEARDKAISAGQIPVLVHRLDALRMCAAAAKDQILSHPDLTGFFSEGRTESVMTWQEPGIWCRAMIDRLPLDPRYPVFDLKTTATSASPEEWQKRLVSEYATQAAFYLRGLKAIKQPRREFFFVVVECNEPFGLSVFTPDGSLMEYANQEIDRAISIWRQCVETGKWPGYSQNVAYVSAPAWLSMRQEERALREEIATNHNAKEFV